VPPTRECEQAIETLRDEIRKLPPVLSSADPWTQHRQQLRHDILTRDPRAFFAWEVIAQTMCPPPYARFLQSEKRYLAAHNWRPSRRFRTANAIHQAYHVYRFQTETGVGIRDFDFILEFGGGYGEMRRVIHELGFRGRYTIFDLPEFTALQRFYLSSHHCGADLQSGMPSLGSASGSRKLFIAAWSFDETPVETRAAWTQLLSGFDGFLLAYQLNFAGIDNQAFFSRWQQNFPRVQWSTQVIPQLRNSFYLFGVASSG
jgi:hypothetical protein